MTLEPLNYDKFSELITSWHVPDRFGVSFLYKLHEEALEGVSQFLVAQPTNPIRYINPIVLTLYCLHEHIYIASRLSLEAQRQVEDDSAYQTRIISAAIDKYLTNEHLEFRENAVKSRFFPPLTTLKLYVNTINGMLSGFQSKQPKETLLTDISKKCFSLMTCAIDLLSNGFETEAFSTWRTMHESEAILIVLTKHAHLAIPSYLKHLQYGLAFHGLLGNKDKTDAMFKIIKDEMHKYGLKSKDMKKFIEYGWLYALDVEQETLRLNFRDGIQKIAGLGSYHHAYEMSSEITHSSPLLIYSRRQTFYNLTLINLYETFFRLETIFSKLFVPLIKKEAQNQYLALRNVYYKQLIEWHHYESAVLLAKKRTS